MCGARSGASNSAGGLALALRPFRVCFSEDNRPALARLARPPAFQKGAGPVRARVRGPSVFGYHPGCWLCANYMPLSKRVKQNQSCFGIGSCRTGQFYERSCPGDLSITDVISAPLSQLQRQTLELMEPSCAPRIRPPKCAHDPPVDTIATATFDCLFDDLTSSRASKRADLAVGATSIVNSR